MPAAPLTWSQELVDAFNAISTNAVYTDQTDPRGCWTYRLGHARPVFWWKGVAHPLAHVALFVHRGVPIPPGLFGLHSCDNSMCFNPHHLQPGTAKQNRQDIVDRDRHHPVARAIAKTTNQALSVAGYVSVAHAARCNKISAERLQRAVLVGVVSAATVLGKRYVRRADVMAWLATGHPPFEVERGVQEAT